MLFEVLSSMRPNAVCSFELSATNAVCSFELYAVCSFELYAACVVLFCGSVFVQNRTRLLVITEYE